MNLQLLRKQRNMSQLKLASAIGVSRSTVAMWENGSSQPDNSMLIKLSELFNVSVDYLLGRDETPVSSPSSSGAWIPVLGKVQAGVAAGVILADD